MRRITKLIVAGLTLTTSLLALVEASSGAPQLPTPPKKPLVFVPKLAPLRPSVMPHVRVAPKPGLLADAGTKPPPPLPDAGPVSTPPSPVDASAGATTAIAVLSTAQKNAFLSNVNSLRASLGASSMQTLVWDDNLAQFASTVAGQCQLHHSSAAERTSIAGWVGTYVGENVMGSTGAVLADATNAAKVSADLDFAVSLWWNEKAYYDYPTNTCAAGQVCGHYTQVAWAQTQAIGCAVVMCSSFDTFGSGYSVACEFGPGGNFVGQKPY